MNLKENLKYTRNSLFPILCAESFSVPGTSAYFVKSYTRKALHQENLELDMRTLSLEKETVHAARLLF